jgi:extracellular factor (EF) 3-hydroxypalmitic acid methyl ester biosynthesis protein
MSHEPSTARRLDQPIEEQPCPPVEVRARLQHLVIETAYRLREDDISGMEHFALGLDDIRRRLEPADWHALIADVVAPHPLRARLHEEPFTRRAFTKPRGYPGDAPLLDLIYRDQPSDLRLTPLAQRLQPWVLEHGGFGSVRERRSILATLIDQVAADRPRPRILSLACGHLREAQRSEAVQRRDIEEFVAVDQDTESLAVVDREQRAFNVKPVHMSVRRFLAGPTALGSFDLVYAAGLFDYLAEGVAVGLTRAMFAALRPGGTVVVANFAPELRDIGYMEAIMDWHLIYRSEAEVARFTSGIPSTCIADVSITRDSLGNVIYLSARKG